MRMKKSQWAGGREMPEKDDPKPRRLYVDSDRENANPPVDEDEKERDAQELIELASEVKRNILLDNISTPEINDLLAQADSAINERAFIKAAKIFNEVIYLIDTKYKRGRRYKSFGLDYDFPVFLK